MCRVFEDLRVGIGSAAVIVIARRPSLFNLPGGISPLYERLLDSFLIYRGNTYRWFKAYGVYFVIPETAISRTHLPGLTLVQVFSPSCFFGRTPGVLSEKAICLSLGAGTPII